MIKILNFYFYRILFAEETLNILEPNTSFEITASV